MLNKRLLVILETDGCFADGIEAAMACSVGHRTLRVEDYGKIAATFIDSQQGRAVRVAPSVVARERAAAYTPEETRHYFAQLAAYQTMPDIELLSIQEVCINIPVATILSRPGVRVNCERCVEEVINGRELQQAGMTPSQVEACLQGSGIREGLALVCIMIMSNGWRSSLCMSRSVNISIIKQAMTMLTLISRVKSWDARW